ncbi:DUF6291 domain-containing protein [Bacteroides thetaiotaomicron]|uniref:DUF6291 domain-containing protein n=1 Tax=Bacteroides thetaiotaomicron TaxID=818 RepID=UPI003566997E
MEKQSKKREGFIFYISNYESLQVLSKKNKLIAYEAIVRYGLFGEIELEKLPKPVYGIVRSIMPNIDSNTRKYNNKVSKTKKRMADFDEISDKKVALPFKEVISNDDEFLEDNESELEQI